MSISDWVVMVILAPPLILGCWLIVIRTWTARVDATAAVGWFTGEGRGLRGYHAFLGPAVMSMSTGWLAYILGMVQDSLGSPPDPLVSAVNFLAVLSILFMVLAFWMWAVQWPKFLIPPRFRDPDVHGQGKSKS